MGVIVTELYVARVYITDEIEIEYYSRSLVIQRDTPRQNKMYKLSHCKTSSITTQTKRLISNQKIASRSIYVKEKL